MNPGRWSEIERIYHAALERAEEERISFVQAACREDDELRREVEELLAQEEAATSFLESGALEAAAHSLAEGRRQTMIGRQVGSYRILSLLGAGGMGEVYLAQDQRLERQVALKFLAAGLEQDETARKRILREARSAAALDHPYIGHIHEVGEVDGSVFIAMEYVKGQTLAEKLAKGPLPLEEALKRGMELAEALEAAHALHIVHRDLKPANIMLTADGHIKVMDFGLAKRLVSGEQTESSTQNITAGLTRTGMTLGTIPYMSPEQLRGEEVDTRSDIFSFGLVLYEMLTGEHPFRKAQPMETAGSILRESPAERPELIPPLLRQLIQRMLNKDRRRRYQHVGDVRIELEEILAHSAGEDFASPPESRIMPRRSWREPLLWALLGLTAMSAALLAVVHFRESPEEAPIARFSVTLPEGFNWDIRGVPLISPDGRHLVFNGVGTDSIRRLWIRSVQSLTLEEVRGSDGASWPFWSPDSRFIGFFAGEKLKKFDRAAGMVLPLCEAPLARGGTWNRDGTILFGTRRDGLFRVSAAGGTAAPATSLDRAQGALSHRWPHFLPDGRHFLFSLEGPLPGQGGIYLGSLDSEKTTRLSSDWSNAVYAAPGYLLLVRGNTLMALPFDAGSLEITGEAFPLEERVFHAGAMGLGHFSLSQRGVLAYRLAPDMSLRRLAWFDRKGRNEPLNLPARRFRDIRLSPAGSHLAATVEEQDGQNIWIYDLIRSTATRITFETKLAASPLFTLDGKRVVYSSRGPDDQHHLDWKPVDGSGQVQRLLTSSNSLFAASFHPTEKGLVLELFGNGYDLHLLSLENEPTAPRLLLQTRFDEINPVISPDGRWIAYSSDESGRFKVYVRPFPNLEEGLWQISGGERAARWPAWSPTGGELFYIVAESDSTLTMMRVPIQTSASTLTLQDPEPLFAGGFLLSSGRRPYDVSPDGQRFLMMKEEEAASEPTDVIVVLNRLN